MRRSPASRFSATALKVTYTPASGTTPDQFTVTGDASLGASIGGTTQTIGVDFGGGGTTGLVLSGGTVQSLNMTITASLSVGGVSFDTSGLVVTDDVSASSSEFTITGPSDFTLGQPRDDRRRLRGRRHPGTRLLENGSLSSLNMTVTSSSLTVGGLRFTATDLAIAETVSTGMFTMTGGSSFDIPSLGQVAVQFGSPGSDGNPASTGLVIPNGSLTSLDMTVTSNLSAAGVTLTANGLHFVYEHHGEPDPPST